MKELYYEEERPRHHQGFLSNFLTNFIQLGGIEKIVLPLVIGLTIWILSAMQYGGYFDGQPVVLSRGAWIGYIVLYFVVWFVAIGLASVGQNLIAFGAFCCGAWITGFLESNILVWAVVKHNLSVSVAKNLLIECTIIASVVVTLVAILGAYLDEHTHFESRSLWGTVMIMGLVILVVEPIYLLIVGFEKGIALTSVIVIAWVVLGTIWDGTRLMETLESDRDDYMLLTMSFFLSIVIIAIRLFMIIVRKKK